MKKEDTIVVTGARGLFGSAMVEHLRAQGYQNVVAVGREECDLVDLPATRRYFEKMAPQYVFHGAGRVYGIMGNMKNKALSFYDNVLINTSVVDAAQKAGVKKIAVMGTGAVYPYPPPAQPFTEDMIFMGEPHKSRRFSLARQARHARHVARLRREPWAGLDLHCVLQPVRPARPFRRRAGARDPVADQAFPRSQAQWRPRRGLGRWHCAA